MTTTTDRPTGVAAAPGPTGAGRPPRIDPRLRERRIAVQREAGRRRLRLLAVAAGALALVGVLVGLLFSPLLAVQDVRVDGAVYADPAAVAEAVALVDGAPLLTADLGALERRLEAIPWVKRVEVRRDWRRRAVQVGLVERRPVAAFFATDGRYRVIDPEGVVLTALDGQPVDVVGVGVPGGAAPAVAPGQRAPEAVVAAAGLANLLPPDLRARVREVSVDGAGALTLHLLPVGEVLLGPPEDLREKVLATLAVLADVDPDRIERLDVRVPGTPVLTERAP